MEIISKILCAVIVGIIIVACILGLIEIILRVLNYFLDWKIKKRKRENALLALKNIKLAYENLMLCRTNYHKVKYIEDEEKRVKIQAKIKVLYEEQLQILSNPDYTADKEYLTDEERAELEEVLSRPRYGLF